MISLKHEIVTKPAFRAIGLKWEGSYQEIPNLKKVIQTSSERVGELEHAVDPAAQLGLSYHTRRDGFVHYSVYEVSEEQGIPEGMIEIRVPELTYLVVQHHKGEDIGQTYYTISTCIAENNYQLYKEPGVDYYDSLPLKFEKYPADRDLQDPHFEIMIPIVKPN